MGKVIAAAQVATGGMIGIAQVDLSLAPVGSELYVQPSEGRLRLELEVANDNAMSWKRSLETQHTANTKLRQRCARLEALLRNLAEEPTALNEEELIQVKTLIGDI